MKAPSKPRKPAKGPKTKPPSARDFTGQEGALPGQERAVPSRARVVDSVLERIRAGTPIKNAFALEGVPKRTAYDWMDADEGLRDAVDMARAEASEVRRVRFEADPSAPFLHYIQTLDPENFPQPKQRVGLSGDAEGGPVEVKHSGTIAVDVTEAVRIARQAKESGK